MAGMAEAVLAVWERTRKAMTRGTWLKVDGSMIAVRQIGMQIGAMHLPEMLAFSRDIGWLGEHEKHAPVVGDWQALEY